MTDKYSHRNLKSLKTWVLSISLIIISFLFLVQHVKYTIEKKNLERTTMELYYIQVESPLISFLNYLGIHVGERPEQLVDWEEREFLEELVYYFRNIDDGIHEINNRVVGGIPEEVNKELQQLQGTVNGLLSNIHVQESIDENIKTEIMNFSGSIYLCNVYDNNRSWEQIITELGCLNEKH